MDTGNLDSFLVIYSNFAKAENQSVRSTEAVLLAVRQYNKFVGHDRGVDSITGEDLRQYIRLLQQQEKGSTHPNIAVRHVRLSPHSVASYVRSIRSFWSWLLREGFIQENPFERVKPPKTPRKVIAPLTPEQIASLIKAIPRTNQTGERDHALVIVLYGTGL